MMYLVVPALVGAAAAEEFMGRNLAAFDAAATYKHADNTINGANQFADKDMVLFEKGTGVLKAGLAAGTLYCVSDRKATSFKLKKIEGANNTNWSCTAGNGDAVPLTDNATNKGSATNKFYEVALCDGKADVTKAATYEANKATKFHTKDGCNMANGSMVAYAGPNGDKAAHPNAKVVKYVAGTDATWYTAGGVVEKGKTFTLKTTAATPADVVTTLADQDLSASKQHYWFVRNAADKQFPLVAAAGGNAARSASMVAMTVLGAAAMVFA